MYMNEKTKMWRPARPVDAPALAVYRFSRWTFLVGWAGTVTLHLLMLFLWSTTTRYALAGAALSLVSLLVNSLTRRLTDNVASECAMAAAARELTLVEEGTAVQVDEDDPGYAGVPDTVTKWVRVVQVVWLACAMVYVTAAMFGWELLTYIEAAIIYTPVIGCTLLWYRVRRVLRQVKWGP